ncbi:hypothetical protein BLNAU_16874 [Blattamonas nauphoetae]|uniref:Lunapark zinc ribbon domain-containing protein n=1 Tax=Blattamonas nauphoetae TaxID=2049346 RepID=A0ABQ9XAC4_9EUKA|nr:hypothetical protein BLNAU_16874 [Blattamonas nauphoetae]
MGLVFSTASQREQYYGKRLRSLAQQFAQLREDLDASEKATHYWIFIIDAVVFTILGLMIYLAYSQKVQRWIPVVLLLGYMTFRILLSYSLNNRPKRIRKKMYKCLMKTEKVVEVILDELNGRQVTSLLQKFALPIDANDRRLYFQRLYQTYSLFDESKLSPTDPRRSTEQNRDTFTHRSNSHYARSSHQRSNSYRASHLSNARDSSRPSSPNPYDERVRTPTGFSSVVQTHPISTDSFYDPEFSRESIRPRRSLTIREEEDDDQYISKAITPPSLPSIGSDERTQLSPPREFIDLICQNCHALNGKTTSLLLPNLEYYCPHCNHLNQPNS